MDIVLPSTKGPYLDEVAAEIRVVDLATTSAKRSLRKLIKYLRVSQPEVMISALDHANTVAILAGILARTKTRIVVSVRSVPTAVYREDQSVRRWFMLQVIRVLYPFADMIIANSKAASEDLSDSLGIPFHKLRVIYNPLDLEGIRKLSGELVEHSWAGSNEPPVVVSIGSLAVLKDFPTLIRAFAIVRKTRECRLVILGEGPDRYALESLIDDLGLKPDVYLPGFVSNPFPWLKAAAVFVSSSLTEGCPNALLQALACNTAIVSTDCAGGSAEVLENGRWGTLVPIRNAEVMAEAILNTLEANQEPDLTQRAKDFAMKNVAAEYLNVMLPADPAKVTDGQN